MYAATIEPFGLIYFVPERPEGDRWSVQDDVEIDIAVNYPMGHPGGSAGEEVLCVSVSDPKHYKIFKDPRDVDPTKFRPTGRGFGGVFARSTWRRLAEGLAASSASWEVPDDDPPGAMDEAIRNLRGGR